MTLTEKIHITTEKSSEVVSIGAVHNLEAIHPIFTTYRRYPLSDR